MSDPAVPDREPGRPHLLLLDGLYAIARLEVSAPLPAWAMNAEF